MLFGATIALSAIFTSNYLQKSQISHALLSNSNQANLISNLDNLNSDVQYIWYRQNSDGTWSHKPGKTAVVKVDRSNEIIYDPEACDRTTGSPSYSVFVGFYQVNIQGMI